MAGSSPQTANIAPMGQRPPKLAAFKAATGRAAALDAFEVAVMECFDAGIDEQQLRDALIKALDNVGGRLPSDPLLERRLVDGVWEWRVTRLPVGQRQRPKGGAAPGPSPRP